MLWLLPNWYTVPSSVSPVQVELILGFENVNFRLEDTHDFTYGFQMFLFDIESLRITRKFAGLRDNSGLFYPDRIAS